MNCERGIEVQAYFDGEVDALKARELEQHLAGCGPCARLIEELTEMRRAMEPLRAMRAPDAVRSAIVRALARESRGADSPRATRCRSWIDEWLHRPMITAALGVLAGVAVALGLVMNVSQDGGAGRRMTDEILTDHLRSLLPGHLLDVESTDRHTVKPWFAGHADASPTVADFASRGYALVGGRVDVVDRRRAAVLVYRHGAHLISVFTWAAGDTRLPAQVMRDGYRVLCWRAADLEYCAVSDAGQEEIATLESLILEATPPQ
jgi:anti-sigma factor RsiW